MAIYHQAEIQHTRFGDKIIHNLLETGKAEAAASTLRKKKPSLIFRLVRLFGGVCTQAGGMGTCARSGV